MLTKNSVIKSGSRLGRFDENHDLYAHDMEVLSEWRRSHVAPMRRLNLYARKRANGFNQAIVAQRLKRIPTIISKLKDRAINCDLYSMQDIGGVRVILENVTQVEYFIRTIKKKTPCRKTIKFYDYIGNPKASGYRGYHIVFNDLCDGITIPVELQVRSGMQHSWAMALESFDVMNKTNLKRGHGDESTNRFMRLCSALFSVMEDRAIIDEFANVPVKNIVSEIENMSTILQKLKLFTILPDSIFGYFKKNGYYLLQLDADNKTVIATCYENDIDFADKQYLSAEKALMHTPSKTVVLVEANDVNNLKKAYPSYFLDNMEFINNIKMGCKKFR